MKNEKDAHPADALAAALNRASMLLAALSDLYDPANEEFAGGSGFVAHGLSTASELIEKAGAALADLNENYNIQPVDLAPPEPAAAEEPRVEPSKPQPPEPKESPVIARAVATLQEAPMLPDEPAKGYRELLDKITKAESSGALAAGTASRTSELLPMLAALRKEMQKTPGVA